ncbi:MAG: response regulator [Oscillatoriales cyanobacterium C42_A2020_001]|nr:response regulator [Leptolyngbyaceae cyanobacterium C42_A2020_001]
MRDTQTINVLLVEDDEVDVMNVKRAFKKNQINNPLHVAANGVQALEMLRGDGSVTPTIPSSRCVIILDLNMPKMGGLEFLQELRSDPILRFLPVVVLTTSDQQEDRRQAYEYNVAGYLIKPVTFAAFSNLIAVLNQYWMLNEMP